MLGIPELPGMSGMWRTPGITEIPVITGMLGMSVMPLQGYL